MRSNHELARIFNSVGYVWGNIELVIYIDTIFLSLFKPGDIPCHVSVREMTFPTEYKRTEYDECRTSKSKKTMNSAQLSKLSNIYVVLLIETEEKAPVQGQRELRKPECRQLQFFSTSVDGFEALIYLDSEFDKDGKNKLNCEQPLQTNVDLACFSTVLRKPRIYRRHGGFMLRLLSCLL